jgi:hypothetical protein
MPTQSRGHGTQGTLPLRVLGACPRLCVGHGTTQGTLPLGVLGAMPTALRGHGSDVGAAAESRMLILQESQRQQAAVFFVFPGSYRVRCGDSSQIPRMPWR